MELINLARHLEIGANCFLLRVGGNNIVLDCGSHPRYEEEEGLPQFGLLRDERIDAIFLSHAHMDHAAALPLLQRFHPEARVFMTQATCLLAEAMMHNSVNVMTKKRDEGGYLSYPLYTHKEVEMVAVRWEGCPVGIPINLDGERCFNRRKGEVTFRFFNSGHILGAVAILIESDEGRLLFSGDVQFEDQEICRGAGLPEEDIDVLMIETTRGAAPRQEHYTREAEVERLAGHIRKTFRRHGSVLMPLFALGRTQEMLTILHDLKREGQIPSCPIYVGGLSNKLNALYDRIGAAAPRHRPEFKISQDVRPQVMAGRQIHKFRPRSGYIYGISSGMMTENTLSNLFAKYILPNPDNSLFFVGYSDPASPAGKIRAGRRGDTIRLHDNAKPVVLECEVHEFDFSAHAPRKQLMDYIRRVNAPRTVLMHGDQPALEWFTEEIRESGLGTQVIVPEPGKPTGLNGA